MANFFSLVLLTVGLLTVHQIALVYSTPYDTRKVDVPADSEAEIAAVNSIQSLDTNSEEPGTPIVAGKLTQELAKEQASGQTRLLGIDVGSIVSSLVTVLQGVLFSVLQLLVSALVSLLGGVLGSLG